jgi:hypothetical protein
MKFKKSIKLCLIIDQVLHIIYINIFKYEYFAKKERKK